MRLLSMQYHGQWRTGLVDIPSQSIKLFERERRDLDWYIRQQQTQLFRDPRRAVEAIVPIEDAVMGAPVRGPASRVWCVGRNYAEHIAEMMDSSSSKAAQSQASLTLFSKAGSVIIGPHDDIEVDPVIGPSWDYEAELALVIGKPGRNIAEHDSMRHVVGVCVANDVSQRDMQYAYGGQWMKGKNMDRTMPLGPWLATLDSLSDIYNLTVRCRLNDLQVQQGHTSDMLFKLEAIVAECSRGTTLLPGDIILTGTPSGVGMSRDPKLFLQDGDTLTTEISELGVLENRVKAVSIEADV